MECKQTENMIDAYLDEELDPVNSAAVETHLQSCPPCSAHIERRRILQRNLRVHLPYHPAPELLRETFRKSAPPVHFTPYLRLAIAAGVLFMLGGMSFSYLSRSAQLAPTALLADAVESSHMRSLQPDHLMDVVSTDQHTVKPWFAGKLPFAPPVRDLAAEGFPLVGGRLDVIDHQTAAALIYHHAKHTINLFIWPQASTTTTSTSMEAQTTPRGFHIIHWSSGGMTFWAVSDLEMDELMSFATLLTSKPAPSNP